MPVVQKKGRTMPEQPPAGSPALSQIQNSLHAIAEVLRRPGHLTPETQAALAELVDEVGNALQSGCVPSPEMAHLTESTAHLLEALRQRHDSSLIAAARDRLEEAIVGAETKAPVLAGLAHRLVDALSTLGI
jgi:hypothetical protein